MSVQFCFNANTASLFFLVKKQTCEHVFINMMSISGRLYSLYNLKVCFICQLVQRSFLYITNKWQIFALKLGICKQFYSPCIDVYSVWSNDWMMASEHFHQLVFVLDYLNKMCCCCLSSNASMTLNSTFYDPELLTVLLISLEIVKNSVEKLCKRKICHFTVDQ